jgi:hypothetical protein
MPEGPRVGGVAPDELLAPIVDRGRAAFAEVRDSSFVTDERATFGWVERTLPEGRWQVAPAALVAQLATLLGTPRRGRAIRARS